MTARKDALMEELIMHCEVRGELGTEGNAKTEARIAEIQKELAMTETTPVQDNRYTLWKNGYNVNKALYVEIVDETSKAFKFKCLDSAKEYTFFMPKSACAFDVKNVGIIQIARWFTIEGFLSFLFDRYASVYAR